LAHSRIILCLSAIMALTLAGCRKNGDSQDVGAPSRVILKIAHVLPVNEPIHQELLVMARQIEQRSEGTLEIQIYPNSELGSNKDNLEQILRGANLITVADPGYVGDYLPDYTIMNGPYLYRGFDDIQKLAQSEWQETMKRRAEEKGIKILAMDWYFGPRHFLSDKPIRTPADLKNLKVRVPPNAIWIETIRAMGGLPTLMQWSEVYTGLAQGVVDAVEAPLSSLYGTRLYEVKKHISLTAHFHAIAGLQISKRVFDSLTARQQTILLEEVDAAGRRVSREVQESETRWRSKLEQQGVQFHEADAEAFRTACREVYDKFPDWSAGLYEQVQAALKP